MLKEKEFLNISGNPEDKQVVTDAAKDQPGTKATANGSIVDGVPQKQHQNESKLTSQFFLKINSE